jgi:hypothetical protein
MKIIKLALLCALAFIGLSQAIFGQNTYVDPNERQKRGLLEEGEQEVKVEPKRVVQEKINVKEENPNFTRLCHCEHLSVLTKKLSKRYRFEARQEESLEWDYNKYYRYEAEYKKVEKLVKILRNRHDLEDQKCPYIQISETKFKDLKKVSKKQRPLCDVDALM